MLELVFTLCAVLLEEPRSEQVYARGEVVAVCADGAGSLIVATRDALSPRVQEFHIVRANDSQPLADVRVESPVGHGLQCRAGGGWWFSVAGTFRRQTGVQFVESSGTRRWFVPLELTSASRWTAIEGYAPTGLHISGDRVTEVRAEGVMECCAEVAHRELPIITSTTAEGTVLARPRNSPVTTTIAFTPDYAVTMQNDELVVATGRDVLDIRRYALRARLCR